MKELLDKDFRHWSWTQWGVALLGVLWTVLYMIIPYRLYIEVQGMVPEISRGLANLIRWIVLIRTTYTCLFAFGITLHIPNKWYILNAIVIGVDFAWLVLFNKGILWNRAIISLIIYGILNFFIFLDTKLYAYQED